MLLQITNIVSGFLLASPMIAGWGGKAHVEKVEKLLMPFAQVIGIVELTLGVIGFFYRMNLIPVHIPNLGASYPQAIPAILVGLCLCHAYLKPISVLDALIEKMKPYREWIGIMAIASGANSILFGCWLCRY